MDAALCSSVSDPDLCLPCGLARMEQGEGGLRVRHRRVPRQQSLFRAGDDFEAIHVVRAGSLKTVLQLADGAEQVAGFHLPGEILGLDGLARGRHDSTAVALEDSEVLVLPYPDATWWRHSATELHAVLARLISREVVRGHGRLQLLALHSAEARVAAFLLDLSRRMQGRGFSPVDFVLRPTRQEIGSYLGLKLETVSRALGRLARQRLVEVDGRKVRLRDLEALQRIG